MSRNSRTDLIIKAEPPGVGNTLNPVPDRAIDIISDAVEAGYQK
jgi:hypothetical protein